MGVEKRERTKKNCFFQKKLHTMVLIVSTSLSFHPFSRNPEKNWSMVRSTLHVKPHIYTWKIRYLFFFSISLWYKTKASDHEFSNSTFTVHIQFFCDFYSPPLTHNKEKNSRIIPSFLVPRRKTLIFFIIMIIRSTAWQCK